MAKKKRKGWDGYNMRTAALPKAFHVLASSAKLSGSAYNVFIFLWHNIDVASGRVNSVSYKDISRYCKLSERQVYRAVKELREKGFYHPTHREQILKGNLSPLLPPR